MSRYDDAREWRRALRSPKDPPVTETADLDDSVACGVFARHGDRRKAEAECLAKARELLGQVEVGGDTDSRTCYLAARRHLVAAYLLASPLPHAWPDDPDPDQ